VEIGSAWKGRQERRQTGSKHHYLGPAAYLAFSTVQADKRITVNSYKTLSKSYSFCIICYKAVISMGQEVNVIAQWQEDRERNPMGGILPSFLL